MAITADYTTLVDQASGTVDMYLGGAIRSIDAQFGTGYAKGHPELVAAFIKAAASDYNNAALIIAIQEATTDLSTSLHAISESLRDE